MRVLLDTNVLSEIRRSDADPAVVQRIRDISSENAYLSSITIGEIVYGIARLPQSKKRRELEAWLIGIEQTYTGRILPLDAEAAHIWGALAAQCQSTGDPLSVQDAQIAATAIRHGLHVMTRNVGDFEPTGVRLINPWEGQAS